MNALLGTVVLVCLIIVGCFAAGVIAHGVVLLFQHGWNVFA